MNILEINTIDTEGGAAKVAWRLKVFLEKSGNQVSMLVKHKYSQDKNVREITELNTLSNFFLKIIGKDIWSAVKNKLRPILANDVEFFGSKKILETNEFKNSDLVHCHNLHGQYFDIMMLTQISKQKPVVWTLHDMWAITPHCAHTQSEEIENGFFKCNSLNDYQNLSWDNSRHLSEVKEKAYLNSKIELVVPCRWLEEKIKKSVLAEKNIHVIPNGVDTSIFSAEDKNNSRKNLGLPLDKKVILFSASGGLSNLEKGGDLVQLVAEKFRGNENIVFLIIGEKENENRDNFIFREYESDEKKMAMYYNTADLLLFPSKAETLPLSVLESMSCGTPVVSSNVGGVSEIVDHKQNGFLMTSRNLEQTEAGINWFFDQSDDSRKTIIENGIKKIQKSFNIDTMFDKYQKLYREITNK